MQIQRCPECGNRLTSNYCDICMRRVPFAGLRSQIERDPWEDFSAHRAEKDHKCITFDTPKPASPKPVFPKSKSAKPAGKNKPALALILTAVSLIGIFNQLWSGFREDVVPQPEYNPQYNAEAWVAESDLPELQSNALTIDDEIFINANELGLYYEEPAVVFEIDNKSGEDIHVMTDQVAVNGCMIVAGMNVEVPAHSTAQGVLQLYRQDLEVMNAGNIARIDLNLQIYDGQTYDMRFCQDVWTLYTDAEETCSVDRSGWEMIQDADLSVRLQAFQVSGQNGGELLLQLENLSDDTVYFYTNALFVNGQEVEDTFWMTSLLPGTCTKDVLYLGELDSLGLKDLSEINEIIIEYTTERTSGAELKDQVLGSVLFNPNALPTSE